MQTHILKKKTIVCAVLFFAIRYLWLQLDAVHYRSVNHSNVQHKTPLEPIIFTDVMPRLPVLSSIIQESKLADALSKVTDPVFVVYGNSGYSQILSSFICNMEIFPPMHSHILVIVTDDNTAALLQSISSQITVFVSRQNLSEAYDFESSGYLKLMLARGLVLVELLELARVQSKTLIWLEPDFHYTQNLLLRTEMTETVSDIVLYLDHEMYCGCFIRFAPVLASLLFYKEIMDRMQYIHSNNGNTNDQIILNAVVSDLSPNFTVFDRCLYRSGTYNTGGYMLEYQQACKGVRPVAQHHNWIVGAESKVQMAKASGGWFLSDDALTCRQRDMLVVVMTMNRPKSLERLLKSVDTAEYLPGSTVDLRVTVDRDYNGMADVDTLSLLDSIKWSHGLFEVIVWPKKVGLYGQWVHSWPAELYPETLYKAVVLLEDDLEVSPHYSKWFIGAHAAYGGLPGVGAVTGQRPNLVAAVNGPESVASQVPVGVKAFGYLLMATWSLSPKHSVWKEFRQWVLDKRANHPGFVPLVPGMVPSQWYEHFMTRGEEENMWEMWFIRFVDERRLHTVYPWVDGGSKTMVGNWMEAGLHFSGTPSLDFPITSDWDEGLLMQKPLSLVSYNLDFGIMCIIGSLFGRFNNQLLAVSWAMMLARQSGMQLFLKYDSAHDGYSLQTEWDAIFGVVVGVSWIDSSFDKCSKSMTWHEIFSDMLDKRSKIHLQDFTIPLPVESIRAKAVQVWKQEFPRLKRRITVHGRSFEGNDFHCKGSGHAAFRCNENLCDYRQSDVLERFSFFIGNYTDIVLFSDGQNQDFAQSYQLIEHENPLVVQMWMMVISDVHIGHPGSSQDYVAWMWRQQIKSSGFMLPWECYNAI